MSPITPLASTEDALTRLESLVSGLLFVSEAGYPLRVLRLGPLRELDARAVLLAVGRPAAVDVSEIARLRHQCRVIFQIMSPLPS